MPAEPSSASGLHTQSSLRVEDKGRDGADETRGQMGDQQREMRSEKEKQQDFRAYVM